ncbi:putative lipid II flippase FtsW [Patescibacteria group bacterium]
MLPKPHRPDYLLSIVVFILVVFGLIMVSSASVVQSFENTGDTYYYFKHQLIWGVIFGMIAMFVFSRISYDRYKKLGAVMLVTTFILLILVLIFGRELGGSRSWIFIGSFSFQPTEFVKLLFVLYLAVWLEKRHAKLTSFREGFLPFLVLLAAIAVLVALQPDLGTLSVILLTAVIVYFVAGGALKHIVALIVMSGAGLFGLIKMFPHAATRFTAFLHPELDPQGIGYQINQALLAIGSGGIIGLGLGNSRQKFNYLPEASGDSIFAIIGEELGFIWAVLLILLFVFVAYRGFQIARHTDDLFGKLVAVGITSWIVFQAFINLAGILNLIPFTGIPLPFISYGGSSMLATLIAVGILLNISRYTKEPGKVSTRRRRLA